MKRLLLYVHFNKYDQLSNHVIYQLQKMTPLFEKTVFISNSLFTDEDLNHLQSLNLIDDFIQRENTGYDFAAWAEGLKHIGLGDAEQYDSITMMNDTCFGPLWDMEEVYNRYETDSETDFWGMTNHGAVDAGSIYIDEHLQSYFISFKKNIIQSDVFKEFWNSVEAYTDVQKVIDNYETKYTKLFVENDFKYQAILNTVPLVKDFQHYNFTIHYPHILIANRVPFIKIKTFDLIQHLSPYLLNEIERVSDYPVDLITSHMSKISLPTPPYLLDRKVLKEGSISFGQQKIAVHLHAFYVDLVEDFLRAFKAFSFDFDLFLTTDQESKKSDIQTLLDRNGMQGQIVVTGAKGRDVIPMLKLKDVLSQYDIIGHFHTKKSPEYPHWVGDSWRNELFQMLLTPADNIISQFETNPELGLVIADIPSFFRYTKIVDPWNEFRFAEDMNKLWERMNLDRSINFEAENTFIMSYGTFIWFKYEALEPLFDLDLTNDEIPAEPLPQHTILHAIERILVYLAWARNYDYAISKNTSYITPFVDNRVLNIRPDNVPNTYINFDQIGGIKGALKYIIIGPGTAVKYILRRLRDKIKS
ncbi:rhamnan synthesis F family protein [Streptococcus moroccensis]|uniref:Rhamnosyltransferase n=1 Tax=Streptococcus moroccensis TaxID=1451356 RepID=A0ABT9YQY4_9STRE|nr:rhamnan synthesis F family protein [Streptococcus moroccensis]MDQ0222180.1 rhamnosyltransferase [Streptococcus moroccensis]